MLKLHLQLLLLLGRKLELRQDDILLLVMKVRVRWWVRLIDGFLMDLLVRRRRLFRAAWKYDSSLDAGVGDARYALNAAAGMRILEVGVDETKRIRRRRKMRRRWRELVLT